MTLAEPLQIIQKIIEVFEKLDIPYFIGGSLASSLHGIPRATQDVDIVADIREHHIFSLVDELQNQFYISKEMIQDALQHGASFNVIHLDTMFKIDIFLLKEVFDQTRMDRRENYQVSDSPSQNLYLSTAEDIILHKLYWYQISGESSERQWNDVIGVLQVQSIKLDYDYLKQSAKDQGVSQLLDRALIEVNEL